MRSVSLGLACLIALSACSNGTSEDDMGGTVSAEISSLTGTPEVDFAFDAGENTVTIRTGDPLSPTLNTFIVVPAGFIAFSDATDSTIAMRGVTPSGDGVVSIYSDGSNALTGAFAARLGDTVLPSAGRVVYDGDYVGILRETGTGTVAYTVTGSAQLAADFEDGEIFGIVDNRSVRELDDTPIRPTNTLYLDTTTLTNGAFAGTTAGGGLTLSAAGAQTGAYSGLIIGGTGGELVTNVEFNHTINDTISGHEVGAIIATDD